MKEDQTNLKVATLAGGCFWCIASDFEKVSGVAKIISGYTGGQKENPTYEEVTTGKTGHYEAVQVYYNPSKVSYEQVLDIFWHHIDPTDPSGQFADRGPRPGPRFSTTMRNRSASRRHRRQILNNPVSSRGLSSR